MNKIDGHPVKDGWLMRYSRRRVKWVRRMPVAEWQARKLSIVLVDSAKTPEEACFLLEREKKAARARRRKWAKEL